MFVCVESLESSLAFSESFINASFVAGGGERPVCGRVQTAVEDPVRQRCVLRGLGWDPGLCLRRPFPEGAGTSASPRRTALVGEDTWLCVLSTPQPGIWDPEEKTNKGRAGG